MRKHRDAFERLLDRLKTLTYPGGQVDFEAVADEKQQEVDRLYEEVVAAVPEDGQHRRAAQQLVTEAEKLGALNSIINVSQHSSGNLGRFLSPVYDPGTSSEVKDIIQNILKLHGGEPVPRKQRGDDDDPPSSSPTGNLSGGPRNPSGNQGASRPSE